MRQVLKGLRYLHSKSIIHRDIKPSNILLTDWGQVKIADFDVATQVSGMQSMSRTCVGTPHYIAPEVVLEESSSYAQDIWSVGCCTLELATGHPPFHECQGVQAMYRMVEEDHPPLPDTGITDELRDFLKICWAKDPKQRPTAKDLLDHAWLARHRWQEGGR
jgi:serine/threonine protein kinase